LAKKRQFKWFHGVFVQIVGKQAGGLYLTGLATRKTEGFEG